MNKLGRAQAAERHLVIVVHPFSPAGTGIPLGLTARHERGPSDYAIPSLMAPQPLTHLWLLPARTMMRDALRWTREGGWAVLEA